MVHEANHPVRTSEKTLALIRELRENDGARIHELETSVDMTKGAVHNHLSTLREHGFVTKAESEYSLSLEFLTLGGHVRSSYQVFTYGRPKADQLAKDTGMLVNVMTEENGEGVYLYQSRGANAVNLYTHVGYRVDLNASALGKAILAHLPRGYVDDIFNRRGLPAMTEHTVTDRERLYDYLDEVAEQSYAIEHEEMVDDLSCVAAPIRVDDELLGAISVSAPTRRLGKEGFMDDIVSDVLSTAKEISLDIKYK